MDEPTEILNADILQTIFALLSDQDWYTILSVCKLCRSIIKTPYKRSRITDLICSERYSIAVSLILDNSDHKIYRLNVKKIMYAACKKAHFGIIKLLLTKFPSYKYRSVLSALIYRSIQNYKSYYPNNIFSDVEFDTIYQIIILFSQYNHAYDLLTIDTAVRYDCIELAEELSIKLVKSLRCVSPNYCLECMLGKNDVRKNNAKMIHLILHSTIVYKESYNISKWLLNEIIKKYSKVADLVNQIEMQQMQ